MWTNVGVWHRHNLPFVTGVSGAARARGVALRAPGEFGISGEQA